MVLNPKPDDPERVYYCNHCCMVTNQRYGLITTIGVSENFEEGFLCRECDKVVKETVEAHEIFEHYMKTAMSPGGIFFATLSSEEECHEAD